MLVTRTERYVDWHFQTAHANEQAATVGVGLLQGHIYYRHSYDMLKAGDTVEREKSYVLLSDGSSYELGEGLSGEKVTIRFEGLTSSNEVYITVQGKPELGIGVTSIYRDVTIQFDDGKVPVLDTEQLEGILTDLSDSLTDSMIDTAEKVKVELSEQVDTVKVEANAHAVAAAETAKQAAIQEASQMAQRVSGEAGDEMTRKDNALKAELVERIDSKIRIAQWTIGQYTVATGQFNNLLGAAPDQSTYTDPMFVYDSTNKSLRIEGSAVPTNRILRISFTGTLDIPEGFRGNFSLHLRNTGGGTLVQQLMLIDRGAGLPQTPGSVHYSAELMIPKDMNHPIYTTGIRVEFGNNGAHQVKVLSGSTLNLTLLTA